MRPRTLVTPSLALYRVFIHPSLATCAPPIFQPHHALRARGPGHLHLNPSFAKPTPLHRTIYAYARVTPQGTPKPFRHRNMPPNPYAPPSGLDPSVLLDERIAAPTAYLVSPLDNRLGPLTSLAALLRDIDRSTTHLRKVGDAEDGAPVVKAWSKEALVEEAEAREKEKAGKGGRKSEEAMMKTVEMHWGIAENDLGYRIGWMEGFLREGRRVEVVVAKKKGGRVPGVEGLAGLLGRVRAAAKGVEGTEEWKVMEGVVGEEVTLFFWSRGAKEAVRVEREVKAGEARQEKMERKKREREEKREKLERRLRVKKEAEEEREKMRKAIKL